MQLCTYLLGKQHGLANIRQSLVMVIDIGLHYLEQILLWQADQQLDTCNQQFFFMKQSQPINSICLESYRCQKSYTRDYSGLEVQCILDPQQSLIFTVFDNVTIMKAAIDQSSLKAAYGCESATLFGNLVASFIQIDVIQSQLKIINKGVVTHSYQLGPIKQSKPSFEQDYAALLQDYFEQGNEEVFAVKQRLLLQRRVSQKELLEIELENIQKWLHVQNYFHKFEKHIQMNQKIVNKLLMHHQLKDALLLISSSKISLLHSKSSSKQPQSDTKGALLPGIDKDVTRFLQKYKYGGQIYESSQYNLEYIKTKDQILDKIQAHFNKDLETIYLYYSGHGHFDGDLLIETKTKEQHGIQKDTRITPDEITWRWQQSLSRSTYKNKTLKVYLDSCHSGAWIQQINKKGPQIGNIEIHCASLSSQTSTDNKSIGGFFLWLHFNKHDSKKTQLKHSIYKSMNKEGKKQHPCSYSQKLVK